MSDYTPTTDEVSTNFRQNIPEPYGVEVDGAFDRWLAQHDRERDERIIALLENIENRWCSCRECGDCMSAPFARAELNKVIALIKGETK